MIKQQVLKEIPFQNIDVVEIPLKQLYQRKIYSQDAPTKKNNKYQIYFPRHNQKLENVFTEPSKVKSVRFKEEIEIIDSDILSTPKIQQKYEYESDDEDKPPVPPTTLFPLSKISFPPNLDKIRHQIDQDIQEFQLPSKNPTVIHPEIPKRFQSVSRQERDKKINRLNNGYDPWNANYTFAPISARSSSTQQNSKSLNNSYQQLQDYSEQYSYRSFYQQNNNFTNNNSFLVNISNRPKTNQRMSSQESNGYNTFFLSQTTPVEQNYQLPHQQIPHSNKNNYNKQNISFSETSSNYKNFAPSHSNTPTKIYYSQRGEQQEQENSDGLPQIYKSANYQKSTTPISSATGATRNTQQSVNSSIAIREKDKEQEDEQVGEMLTYLKNQKKNQNQKKNKSKTPTRRLKRQSIDLSNVQNKEQTKDIKPTQKFQTILYKQSNQTHELKLNKIIPDTIKNQLLKKIAEQKLYKFQEE